MRHNLLLILAAGIFVSTPAFADRYYDRGRGFDHPRWHESYNWSSQRWGREQPYRYEPHYEGAVMQGLRSGALTRSEAEELKDRQRDIERTRYSYESDGRLSAYERHNLNEKMRDYERNLNHNLNDGERSYGYRRW